VLDPEEMRLIPQCSFLLDANCINARQADVDLNQLEHWNRSRVIDLSLSEPSGEEAAVGSAARERKTAEFFHTMTLASTADEQRDLRIIESILSATGALTQNQRNDVEIVFNAKKYFRILITNDGGSKGQPGGILGNAQQLQAAVGVTVMRPTGAVQFVREHIKKRDEVIAGLCAHYKVAVPQWVGND